MSEILPPGSGINMDSSSPMGYSLFEELEHDNLRLDNNDYICRRCDGANGLVFLQNIDHSE